MFQFNSQDDVERILREIGQRLKKPADAVLYGGTAIILMGRAGRNTDDLDLDCRANGELQAIATAVAAELNAQADLNFKVEDFIDVPARLIKPHARFGQYGQLTVFLCDPALIATSKLDRRLDQDMADIQWLLQQGALDPKRLEQCVEACREFEDKAKVRDALRGLLGRALQSDVQPDNDLASHSTKLSRNSLRVLIPIGILVLIVMIILVVWLRR